MLLLLAVSVRLRRECTEAVAEDHIFLRFSTGNPHVSKVSLPAGTFSRDLHIIEAPSRPNSSTYSRSFPAHFPENHLPGITKVEHFHELFRVCLLVQEKPR